MKLWNWKKPMNKTKQNAAIWYFILLAAFLLAAIFFGLNGQWVGCTVSLVFFVGLASIWKSVGL